MSRGNRPQVHQKTLELPQKISDMKQLKGTLNNEVEHSRDFPESKRVWSQGEQIYKVIDYTTCTTKNIRAGEQISKESEYTPYKTKNPRAEFQPWWEQQELTGGRAAWPTNPEKGRTGKRKTNYSGHLWETWRSEERRVSHKPGLMGNMRRAALESARQIIQAIWETRWPVIKGAQVYGPGWILHMFVKQQ